MRVRLLCVAVIAAVASLAPSARADLFVPSNSTASTSSLAEIDTTVDTAVARTVQRYLTELDFGFAEQAPLSTQTYSVAATDPVFQAAIRTALATLLGGGATSTAGPTRISSNSSVSSANQTVETGRTAAQSFSTGSFVGPATFTSGDFGLCQSASLNNTTVGLRGGTGPNNLYPLLSGCTGGSTITVTIGFGGIDFDTLDLTSVGIQTTTTTTTTTVLSEVYRIDGKLPATVSVPEPRSFTVLAMSILLLGGISWLKLPRERRP